MLRLFALRAVGSLLVVKGGGNTVLLRPRCAAGPVKGAVLQYGIGPRPAIS
jgi:hypothetical protein